MKMLNKKYLKRVVDMILILIEISQDVVYPKLHILYLGKNSIINLSFEIEIVENNI